MGIGDNQISEIVPQSNTEVEIFQHAAFGGGSRLARAAVCLPNVSGGFDNLTSSLRIRRSAVRFSDNFNSGSLAQWSTPIGVWSIQNGELMGEIGFDSAAYATPSRSYGGSLVLDADVNMANGNADSSSIRPGLSSRRSITRPSGRATALIIPTVGRSFAIRTSRPFSRARHSPITCTETSSHPYQSRPSATSR